MKKKISAAARDQGGCSGRPQRRVEKGEREGWEERQG